MNFFATTHRWLCIAWVLFLAPTFAIAQNIQIIDNGTIATGVFGGGQIGGDCSGNPGPSYAGFAFNGVGGDGTVLCAAGFLASTSPANVIGDNPYTVDGSVDWTQGTWSNTTSPYSVLEIAHTTSFSDIESAGLDVDFTVYYSDDDDGFEQFFVAEYVVTNNSGGTLDIAKALWMDWDILPFQTNGAEHNGTTAQWVSGDGSGVQEVFGTAVLGGAPLSGTDCFHPYGTSDSAIYSAMVTLGASPCAPADIRGPFGAGEETVANGETTTALFCVMGAFDTSDFAAQVANCETAIIPVELLWFDSVLDGNDVSLRWATASETNNAGFEVQMDAGSGFQALGFVNGHGTTTEAQTYSFAVRNLDPGTYVFRLKQIDFDGAFEYHGDLEVSVETPDRYVLMPAYPNPFNPEATVRFAVRDSAPVTLTLHDALGRQVSTLYSGTPEANQTLSVRIDGSNLPSGLYLVRLNGSNFSASQPVTLLK